MIGGGITASAIFIKAAMYAQGTIELTAKVPERVAGSYIDSMKWAIREWVESKKRSGPLAKIIGAFKNSYAERAVEKIMTHRAKIMKEIQTPESGSDEDAFAINQPINELITDGMEQHKLFIHQFRTTAAAIIADMDKKSGEAAKIEAYTDGVEKAWRAVYRNKAEVVPSNWHTGKPKCSSISDKAQHPSKLLMCAFFKYGMYLKDNAHDGGKGNANTRAMLPVVYDELFKKQGTSIEGAGVQMTAAELKAFLGQIDRRYQRSLKLIAKAKKAGDTAAEQRRTKRMYRTLGRYIRVFEMEGAGLIYMFALPEADLRKSMAGIVDVTEPDPCEADCSCGVTEIEFEGTIGFTFGSSDVGFCTPDTNPFQITFVSGFKYEKQIQRYRSGSECILKKSTNDDVMTVTLSGSTYLGLDLGWHYDPVDGSYKGWEVNLRFRVPIDQEPAAPVAPEPEAPTAIARFIKALMGDGDEQGFASSILEGKISTFFSNIFGQLTVSAGGNEFMNTIAGGFIGKAGLKSMVEGILKKATVNMADLSITKTIGFDIGFEKVGDKREFKFAFDYLAYMGIGATVPSGAVQVTATGYKSQGARYEYEHDFGQNAE